jgi:ribA/ribD-fused uncharacterized protein
MINCFDGKWAFLSNFYWNEIEHEGIVYPTNEHFFQAMKTLDNDERRQIANCLTPGQAKRMGRRVALRSDWESVKEDVMFLGLCLKFADEQLADWLLETGDEELIEGTTWHDNEWGNCSCSKCVNIEGKNKLGKLLMRVRDMIKEERGLA